MFSMKLFYYLERFLLFEFVVNNLFFLEMVNNCDLILWLFSFIFFNLFILFYK